MTTHYNYKYIVALYYKGSLYQKSIKINEIEPDWRKAIVKALKDVIFDLNPASTYAVSQTDPQQTKLCRILLALPYSTTDTEYLLQFMGLPDDPLIKWQISFLGKEDNGTS